MMMLHHYDYHECTLEYLFIHRSHLDRFLRNTRRKLITCEGNNLIYIIDIEMSYKFYNFSIFLSMLYMIVLLNCSIRL